MTWMVCADGIGVPFIFITTIITIITISEAAIRRPQIWLTGLMPRSSLAVLQKAPIVPHRMCAPTPSQHGRLGSLAVARSLLTFKDDKPAVQDCPYQRLAMLSFARLSNQQFYSLRAKQGGLMGVTSRIHIPMRATKRMLVLRKTVTR